MKVELGRCLLKERIQASGMSLGQLAGALQLKPERLEDYIGNKRIMPLKAAVNISLILDCRVEELYELHNGG
ncbi:helix-turn-helix domain-containing protein [Paenibacillus gansuensis]|uniref:Helix-turn-helix domain-containing protein n=1 Tax=Paenibacillus gansuensis TaxID=306542 RepID=A0ABW5PHA4_9BACL